MRFLLLRNRSRRNDEMPNTALRQAPRNKRRKQGDNLLMPNS